MLSKVLHIEIQKATSAIGGEQIGGNVVKENWWRGYLAALCHIQAECAAGQGEGANLQTHNKPRPKLPDTLLNFMCYLVDNCEGETITEEYLLEVGSKFIKSR